MLPRAVARLCSQHLSDFNGLGRSRTLAAQCSHATLRGSFAAAWRGAAALDKLLRGGGPAVDSADSSGRCALHIAAAAGNVEAVATLLGCGASAGLRDGRGRTAADAARSAYSESHARTARARLAAPR